MLLHVLSALSHTWPYLGGFVHVIGETLGYYTLSGPSVLKMSIFLLQLVSSACYFFLYCSIQSHDFKFFLTSGPCKGTSYVTSWGHSHSVDPLVLSRQAVLWVSAFLRGASEDGGVLLLPCHGLLLSVWHPEDLPSWGQSFLSVSWLKGLGPFGWWKSSP